MITGTTKSGFEFELNDHVHEDYEVIEALVKFFRRTSYDNFVAFTEQMFRGAEDCEKRSRDFLRERDGFVSTEAMQELVFDIWNVSKELKNS